MSDRDERRNELYGGQMPIKHSVTISADEARERAINSGKIKAEEELKPVFVGIKNASGEGKFQVDYVGELSGFAIERLGALGYKVTDIGTQSMDEPFSKKGYRIFWGP